jgi:site-specific DNA-methyltransferase (adenine-specific)
MNQESGMANALYYGDNLRVLRDEIASESVDLIYLDPPFNSNTSYNVLFKEPTGKAAAAQIEAFEDTWHWGEPAEDAFDQVMHSGHTEAADMLRAMRGFLGENDMMAYLAMMAVRLIELHRVLKPTGSLYLHCDPTASHYLKLVLDAIFDPRHFQNEIKWKRTHAHGDSRTRFANVTDILLFYSKGEAKFFERQLVQYSQSYIDRYFRYYESDGRRYQLVDRI